MLCQFHANACKPNNSSGVGQELDVQDLQQQLLARDTDFEELQQQWNLQNFKFCLLVDMVSVQSNFLESFYPVVLKAVTPLCQKGLIHIHYRAVLLQWAMRVLDDEEIAKQSEAAIMPGTVRMTKLSK